MDSIKNMHGNQLFLSALFIIYLVMGFQTPEPLAHMIDTNAGKIIVATCALALFAHSNPILGVLGIFAAYKLIISSTMVTGLGALEMYAPTDQKKWSQFPEIHRYSYTLEQEMVKKMAPIVRQDIVNTKATYKPILENLHDAVSINYNGPI